MNTLAHPAQYAKALIGALVAGLSVISAALAAGEGVTGAVIISAVVAALVSLGAVFAVPNAWHNDRTAGDPGGPLDPAVEAAGTEPEDYTGTRRPD